MIQRTTTDPRTLEGLRRVRVQIHGVVQGVGFRPFVYRLANDLSLSGWIGNSSNGVVIEAVGQSPQLRSFMLRLLNDAPPRASIQSLESSWLDPLDFDGFVIRASDESGDKTALILPDIATCPDCLREINDPVNRRSRYPFTNCTNCGPRFSIITALPYDRPNTTMAGFPMCAACRAEYEDPLNRRFHAQPTACPDCGPHLELWDRDGGCISVRDDALLLAEEAIQEGLIVAVKGLGGFHLMADARDDEAVNRLRHVKHREEKPLALMFPTLEMVKTHTVVSELEERLLLSPEAPIVLLRRLNPAARGLPAIAESVAPGNPNWGIMLPYTPLHHLLLNDLKDPVVATSGNRADEPICTDEHEALHRLSGIANLFLVHNRPIARHVDDSIVRIVMEREMVLRRSRGYAPLPVYVKNARRAILAVGAHLKNTVATSIRGNVIISQHIGDLETAQAERAFEGAVADLPGIYEVTPEVVACDLHPDYMSTQFARRSGLPTVHVQHHHAHVLACMAENQLAGSVTGVAWDGTGYGQDGTIWGGEFFGVTDESIERVAHLRSFPLPGGDPAVREPRRAAVGLFYELFGDQVFDMGNLAPVRAFSCPELKILSGMLDRGVNSPRTTSVGRLFDAVAAILGFRQITTFEGQAAMELEYALAGGQSDEAYSLLLHSDHAPMTLDWEPMIREIMDDLDHRVAAPTIAAKFHNALAQAIVTVAGEAGENRVVLSGGCFQNCYLTEQAVRCLATAGFRPYWHQRVPPNDGGISLGQIVAASRQSRER